MSIENNGAKIDIIIPMYNVQNYIGKCLDSLIRQTMRDIHIIIVDDGSTDDSVKVCQGYAEKDERITILRQKNAGPSAARNAGIAAASAEYLMFVDSDDYVDKDGCKVLYEAIEKYQCEIVCGDYYKATDSGFAPDKARPPRQGMSYPCRGVDFLTESIKQNAMSMCVWLGIYRRKFVVDNELYFENGILHEDELWAQETYMKAQSVAYVDFRFYYHYSRVGSITNDDSLNDIKSRDLLFVCRKLRPIVDRMETSDKSLLYDYIAFLYLDAVYVGGITDADRKFALSLASTPRNKAKALLYALSPKLYLKVNALSKKI